MKPKRKRFSDRAVYRIGDLTHRANGPAVIVDDGSWGWLLHGQWHRYYGPQNSDDGWWYLHGEQIE